jgi:hypothetical protein
VVGRRHSGVRPRADFRAGALDGQSRGGGDRSGDGQGGDAESGPLDRGLRRGLHLFCRRGRRPAESRPRSTDAAAVIAVHVAGRASRKHVRAHRRALRRFNVCPTYCGIRGGTREVQFIADTPDRSPRDPKNPGALSSGVRLFLLVRVLRGIILSAII